MIRSSKDGSSERKIFSTTTTPTASVAAGVVLPISQSLVQGSEIFQRDGDKITVLRTVVRAHFSLNVLVTSATIRYILFYDTTNNGVLPLVTEVLQNTTVVSPYVNTNILKSRFHILADLTIPLILGGSDQVVHKDLVFARRFPIMYSGAADATVSNSRNALFVLVLTDAAANQPIYSFNHQLEYYDN